MEKIKNIAIFGSSRSGKSTLAKMISKRYPNYHIIGGDEIRWAFQNVLPENEINSKGGIGMQEDFPNFLSCLFYTSIRENAGEINYIVESCDMTPQKTLELFHEEDTVLLFLGTPRQTVTEHFQEIRKYQTEKDWTFDRSDAHILKHCEHWISKSKEYEKACGALNIWYVDTSFCQEEVLKDTFEKIEARIFL